MTAKDSSTGSALHGRHLTFIGGGNMAYAIAAGLAGRSEPDLSLTVVDPDPSQLKRFQSLPGTIHGRVQVDTGCLAVDAVVLAVKPQILPAVCTELATLIGAQTPLLLSVAAGVRSADIARWTGSHLAIVRSMPNQGALLGVGASGLFANAHCSEIQKQLAEAIMTAVGGASWVASEADIDSVTAVSGSGPAYFYLLMEAMQKTALEFGLDAGTARQLIVGTARGAAALAEQSDGELATLRRQVTSPGGTTAAAIEHLLACGFESIVHDAMTAAKERAAELADQAARK